MKLVELKLKNYRCYKDETSIKINDLCCIIGKNDIGKSTILEALDSFFNDAIDKGDLSNKAESDTIEITCKFKELPKTIVLDSSVETITEEEYILNGSNELEVKKKW